MYLKLLKKAGFALLLVLTASGCNEKAEKLQIDNNKELPSIKYLTQELHNVVEQRGGEVIGEIINVSSAVKDFDNLSLNKYFKSSENLQWNIEQSVKIIFNTELDKIVEVSAVALIDNPNTLCVRIKYKEETFCRIFNAEYNDNGMVSYIVNKEIVPADFKTWAEWKECMHGIITDSEIMGVSALIGPWGIAVVGLGGGMGCAVIMVE